MRCNRIFIYDGLEQGIHKHQETSMSAKMIYSLEANMGIVFHMRGHITYQKSKVTEERSA